MFTKWVENTVGKEEIAHNEHFLLFPQCFSKDLYWRQVKTRVCLGKSKTITTQSQPLTSY